MSRPRMTTERRAAQGQDCQVRLPGCTGGGEDTVLAHYRLAGTCGTGLKPPDCNGAWACSRCHDAIDQRREIPGMTREEVRLYHAEGVLRTQALLATRKAA